MTHDLSPAHGKDFVFLVPKDPDWAFVFWEVSADGAERCLERLGTYNATMVLRVYEFGEDRRRADFNEFPVVDWLGSRVVLLGRPGRRHQVVLGFRGKADPTFSVLCRSDVIRSPRTKPRRTAAPEYVELVPPVPWVEPELDNGFRPPALGKQPAPRTQDAPKPVIAAPATAKTTETEASGSPTPTKRRYRRRRGSSRGQGRTS